MKYPKEFQAAAGHDPAIREFLRCYRLQDQSPNMPKPQHPLFMIGEKRIIALSLQHGYMKVDIREGEPKQQTIDWIIEAIRSAILIKISDDVAPLLREMIWKVDKAYKNNPYPPAPKKFPYPYTFVTSNEEFIHVGHDEKHRIAVNHTLFAQGADELFSFAICSHDKTIKFLMYQQFLTDALLILLEQKITINEMIHLPKKQQQRGVHPDLRDDRIGVIRLRQIIRPTLPSGESCSMNEYHHQWLVRGHLRNQYFPSNGRHELIWIDPFIKGPEGAPFKESIISLER